METMPRYWKMRRGHHNGYKDYPGKRFKGKDRIAIHQVPSDWKHGGLEPAFTIGQAYYVCGVVWSKKNGVINGISHYMVADNHGEVKPVSIYWFEKERLTYKQYRERFQ